MPGEAQPNKKFKPFEAVYPFPDMLRSLLKSIEMGTASVQLHIATGHNITPAEASNLLSRTTKEIKRKTLEPIWKGIRDNKDIKMDKSLISDSVEQFFAYLVANHIARHPGIKPGEKVEWKQAKKPEPRKYEPKTLPKKKEPVSKVPVPTPAAEPIEPGANGRVQKAHQLMVELLKGGVSYGDTQHYLLLRKSISPENVLRLLMEENTKYAIPKDLAALAHIKSVSSGAVESLEAILMNQIGHFVTDLNKTSSLLSTRPRLAITAEEMRLFLDPKGKGISKAGPTPEKVQALPNAIAELFRLSDLRKGQLNELFNQRALFIQAGGNWKPKAEERDEEGEEGIQVDEVDKNDGPNAARAIASKSKPRNRRGGR